MVGISQGAVAVSAVESAYMSPRLVSQSAPACPCRRCNSLALTVSAAHHPLLPSSPPAAAPPATGA